MSGSVSHGMCLFVEGSSPRLAYVVALVPVEPVAQRGARAAHAARKLRVVEPPELRLEALQVGARRLDAY